LITCNFYLIAIACRNGARVDIVVDEPVTPHEVGHLVAHLVPDHAPPVRVLIRDAVHRDATDVDCAIGSVTRIGAWLIGIRGVINVGGGSRNEALPNPGPDQAHMVGGSSRKSGAPPRVADRVWRRT